MKKKCECDGSKLKDVPACVDPTQGSEHFESKKMGEITVEKLENVINTMLQVFEFDGLEIMSEDIRITLLGANLNDVFFREEMNEMFQRVVQNNQGYIDINVHSSSSEIIVSKLDANHIKIIRS